MSRSVDVCIEAQNKIVGHVRWVQAMRRFATTMALLAASILGGCIASEKPLFAEAEAVADASWEGTYTYKIRNDAKPEELEIFLRAKKYLFAQGNKIVGFATAYKYDSDIYIIQLRLEHEYDYLLLKPTPSGFVANLIPCSKDRFTCSPEDKSDLMPVVAEAVKQFEGPETFNVDKKGAH